ncbi:MAG TPA: prepilin peptidase [Novosphingobium sp.]|nr:prepilin peptidase [Novosphingobium sp.]
MQGGPFSYALLLALATALVIAAVTDLRRRQIDNWLTAAIALTAPLFWLASGIGWIGAGLQLAVALVTFLVLVGIFATGMMGGGDVKLLTALALWVQPVWFLKLVVVMAIVGGVLTLVCALWHFARGKREKIAVPYGIAISAAGLWVLASQHLPTIQSGVQSGLRSAFQSG